MIESPVSVYVIIVNWNNYSDTIDCINSLFKISHSEKQVILVDNGSTDDSIPKITEWAERKNIKYEIISDPAPQKIRGNSTPLIIISLDSNHGFGGANNIGMRFAIENKADYLLLLNNDTIVTADFLVKMLRTAKSSQDVGIVGGKINYFDKKNEVWFSGGYTDSIKGVFYHHHDDCTGHRESDFITGCLMLLPSHIINKAGLFDEKYFLNVEDIDFSYRVRDAGYRLIIDCDAVIYHKVSATIGGLYSLKNQYYFHRNRMLFFRKRLSGFKSFIFFFFQFVVAIPIWMITQILHGRLTMIKGALSGYFDFIRGRWGKCPFFD